MIDRLSHPLHTILHPRSVVVAGASPDPRKMGSVQAMNVLANGFRGEVSFLHPTERQLLGRPAYATPADLPAVPDLALLVTPARVTPGLLDGLGQRGVRHAIVTTGGFSEVGGDGHALAEALVAAARRHGLRFVGPNCIGVLNTHHPVNVTVMPTLSAPGPLGLVSQSGTFVAQLPLLLADRGVRLGKAISVGNSYDIDLVDALEYLAADPKTTAIALYIEGLARGRRFVEVAREVTRRKPIVALYIGGTEAGARAGLSHTASLGGPDEVYDGLFRQAGIVRASTVEELYMWGWALATQPLPRGRRAAILTHSGGPAASMADECERQGLTVPEFTPALQQQIRPFVLPTAAVANPVDLTFTLDTAAFAESLPRVLFHAAETDAILVHGMMDTGFMGALAPLLARYVPVSPKEVAGALRLNMQPLLALPGETGKPLVASTFAWDDEAARSMRAAGVPLLPCPQAAVRTLAALVRAADVTRRPIAEFPPLGDPLPIPEWADWTPAEGPRALDEHASKAALARYGVPVPAEERCLTLPAARAAALRLGYPVVLKGLAPGVAHKSEAGLVHLDLRTETALDAAWNAVEARAPACPRLIAPMLSGDREFVVGLVRVAGFGPCVMLGLGGIYTEALRDVTFRLAPLARADAAGMWADLRARALFGPVRGQAAVDLDALGAVLLAVSRLALEHPEVAEIDINPLRIVSGRPWALDGFVRLAPPPEP